MSFQRTRAVIQRRLANARHEGKKQGKTGIIENGKEVPGNPPSNRVYVRLTDGELVTAWHNNKVDATVAGAWVWVNTTIAGDFEVVDMVHEKANRDFGDNAAAAYQRQLSASTFKTPIQTRLIDTLRVTDVSGYELTIGSARLIGGNESSATVDLSSSASLSPQQARWALISYDVVSQALVTTDGNAIDRDSFNADDIQSIDIPAGNVPVAVAALYGNANELTIADVFDYRQFLFDERHIERVEHLQVAGTLSTGAQGFRIYNRYQYPLLIRRLGASVGTAPTGASLIVSLIRNGAVVGTCTIGAGTHTATAPSVSNNTWAIGDYLQVNVTQVGSTVAGADLTVTAVCV